MAIEKDEKRHCVAQLLIRMFTRRGDSRIARKNIRNDNARCAAGSLNPHPVLRTGVEGHDALRSQARCRSSAFLFTGILHRVSRPLISHHAKKALRLQCLLLVEISARCAAGSLNPHPVRWTGWARCVPRARLATDQALFCSRASCTESLVPLSPTMQKRHGVCSAFCWWR